MEPEITKKERRKRRHYREEEIAGHVARYERSGLNRSQYAKREGLTLSSLSQWLRQKSSGMKPGPWIEVEKPERPLEPVIPGYVMVLGPGVELRLPRGFEVGEVEALVKILREAK
jgi:transposase-like protein